MAEGRTYNGGSSARLVRRLIKATLRAEDGAPKNQKKLNQIRYRARRDGYRAIVDGLARALDRNTLGMLAELGHDAGLVAERFAVLVVERGLRSSASLTLAFRSTLEAVAAERMLRRIVAGRGQPHDEKLASSLSASSRLDLLQALALELSSSEEEDPRDRARREAAEAVERQAREAEQARQHAAWEAERAARALKLEETKVEEAKPVAVSGADWLRGAGMHRG